MKDDISVDTVSTGSLSDSEDESVNDSSPKATMDSSNRFFKAEVQGVIKPTEQRLQRRDARNAQAITERLTDIAKEKKVNAERIDERKIIFRELRAEYNELSDKISHEAEMLKQLKKQKEDENVLLNTKINDEEQVIKPLIKQVFEETEKISFLAASWRAVYTVIYHIFGLKTEHEILCERTEDLAISIKQDKETVKTNTQDINEQTETVKLNAKDYRIRLNEIDKDSHACLGERNLLEANNLALQDEEEDLISQLPTFKNTKDECDGAITLIIKSCDLLIKTASLRDQAIASALSDFLKMPTESTQALLATRMNHDVKCTPKLQALLEEAKGYYCEVGEMPIETLSAKGDVPSSSFR